MTDDERLLEGDRETGFCPLPKTHRRLHEAHLLWHQSLDMYDDPDGFRANLNATIEALRNVTFVLQSEKASLPGFEEWYGQWQTRLKDDPPAKWLHDARRTVVHRGELESHSTAEVRLVTWRDAVVARLVVPAETPSALVLRNLQLVDLLREHQGKAEDLRDAALAIERCWTTTGLDGLELLDALAKAYGLISDLVLDAHARLKRLACIPSGHNHTDFRSTHHLTGTLECMAASVEKRTKVFKLSTGNELTPEWTSEPTRAVGTADVVRRYGLSNERPTPIWATLDPILVGEKILYLAKRMLRRDRYHSRLMFIRDAQGGWNMIAIQASDRTEKHLVMRMVARFVERKGCDAIVEVGEMWRTKVGSVPGRRVGGAQHVGLRDELLVVMVYTREGVHREYLTPFTRGPLGGIKLGGTQQIDGRFPAYLEPVLAVWREQGIKTLKGGKAIRRIWEPDPLDVCFCGGPKRFAECCSKHVPNPSRIQNEIYEATAAHEFDRAEELSRAALAQYVIWVKQHTAPTMHIAQDVHDKLVAFDAAAMEALVRSLQVSLVANGNAHLFVPQMTHLARMIGVPKLSVRLTAFASGWLLASGRIEEAVLQLESLGSLDDIDDSPALLTAARILDLPDQEEERVLLKAVSAADSKEDELAAQLALADHMLKLHRSKDALRLADSLIAETGSLGQPGAMTEALILRWRITESEDALAAAKEAVDRCGDAGPRHHLAGILIDEGRYTEAERMLALEVEAGDVTAKLLVTDARTRDGNCPSARSVFLGINRDEVPYALKYPYAVAAAHLALLCRDAVIREMAIASLLALPSSGTERSEQVGGLLRALEKEGSAD